MKKTFLGNYTPLEVVLDLMCRDAAQQTGGTGQGFVGSHEPEIHSFAGHFCLSLAGRAVFSLMQTHVEWWS
jgi:hypothetical protein